ncbi:MAG TPA: 7TM diverse intracellular signaling domain-containing protein [Flavobacterium sp.]
MTDPFKNAGLTKVLFIIFLFVYTAFAYSQQHITANSPKVISIHPQAEIADAGEFKYSIGSVISNDAKLRFLPIRTENTNLGFTDHYYWVKVALHNDSNIDLQYFLETARPVTDEVNLFIVNEAGEIIAKQSGDHLPFKERSFLHRKPVFEIKLPATQTVRLYLQLKSDGEVISMPLLLRTNQNFATITSLEQLVFGFFYGILFIASIIYLFFYFGLREKSFLYYSMYVICIGLMQFSLDGYFYQYFDPAGGWIADRAVLIFACLSTLALGKYGQEFLRIKQYNHIVNSLFYLLYIATGLLLLALMTIPAALHYAYPLANILGLIVLLLIIASVVAPFAKKGPVDGFFITGIAFLILGFVVFILNNFSLLPNSFFTENSSKLGTGLEVVFLSLSMANFIRKVKDEREEFNRLALVRSEEMNDLKSYFLSNISHELRTPLNAIMNLSETLLCEAEDTKMKENCQIIRYSSQSLLSSVNDIIDFSKIEKDELLLELSDFEPLAVFESVRNNAIYRANEQSLQFTYEISDKIPAVINGDSARLAQILNNVLSNSFKFTATGFVKLNITNISLKNGEVQLVFVISDSGIGIPKDKIHGIFDSFSQESVDNKRKFGGLGLGLYISKVLTDMQRGSIRLSSKVGVGTTCTIKLNFPIVKQNKPVEPMAAIAKFDLEGKRILVVEDNAINQMVIKMITKRWDNTTAVYVANGQESIIALLSEQFDIVLMDLQMPVMDGYEATIAIRNGEAGENNTAIPIIAVTADVMETTKTRVKEIGMNDYLSKPIKAETLYEAIKALV